MSIYVTSEVDLLAMINTASGLTFASNELVYGVPHVTTTQEAADSGHNTKLAVSIDTASTKGTGWRNVFFDRLDLAVLGKYDYTTLVLTEGLTTAQMITLLKKWTGIPFTANDLVSRTATKNSNTVSFVVEAKPTSLGWFGTHTLTYQTPADISTAFPDDTLNGFQ